MRFLIDEQLPPALADRLRENGYVAEHIRGVNLGGAPDAKIRAYAARSGAVLTTKDEDFASPDRAEKFAVLWVRLGNTTNEALWRALEPHLPEIVAAIERGERLIEIA
ncbi:MAG: DUF5615 family PIN-like protein [Pseudomonadota bacterium]